MPMTLSTLFRAAPRAAAALALLVGFSPAPVWADCKQDLVSAQQALQATKSAVDLADKGPDAQKCPAYRRHYAALAKVREVFGRCDTGTKKAEHAAQLNGSIEDFRKQAPRGCRP